MAMKLITHFNENLYDPESEILGIIKKEIIILTNKIQQKLNIELEEGKEIPDEIELFLGDSPNEEAVKEYIHRKYTIRKDLLKQRLSKLLFSKLNKQDGKTPKELQECSQQTIEIFKNSLEEAQNQIEEKRLNFKNEMYKDLWINSLIKHFSEILIILIEKLSKDPDNIAYLCGLKHKILNINSTVYYLIEDNLLAHIKISSVSFAKTIVSKLTKTINPSVFGTGRPKKRIKLLKEDFKEYTTEPKDLKKEYDEAINSLKEISQTISSNIQNSLIVISLIHAFYTTYAEYFETKVVEFGEFMAENITKFIDIIEYSVTQAKENPIMVEGVDLQQ
eukprot:CAMPEP_0205811826 /NCGR_PEP_ID=MMETSP0205-20121125/16109_1 /ASSEMBLY_ACC=CAM_ASM_000278 /TAXON_ID=36767 /ORGANISM="Euplotes focardii, Strain TN1" /LENGTH=333 /DNA_ID=CAMNT_0053091551 /DNA_START=368 /DNA_END=1366 /DNA_ORIENTATION=+